MDFFSLSKTKINRYIKTKQESTFFVFIFEAKCDQYTKSKVNAQF